MKTIQLMNRKFLRGAVLFIIAFVLSNLAFLAQVKAVDPTDTFYGGLAGNGGTTGLYDSGFGYGAFYNLTSGSYNTASGTNALYHNITGNANMASGVDALFSNTTGSTNMASGGNALFSNTIGAF